MKKEKPDFDSYYASLFHSRWDSLKNALLQEKSPVAYTYNLLKPYYMDRGSIIAAGILAQEPAERVLDMCAAPGGKTLVLAGNLPANGTLIANDRSANRRRRLWQVLGDHLPADIRSKIEVTGHDATKWGLFETDRYDTILLDAPCSSERHLLHSPKHMRQWSPSRSKRLAQQALAMLLAAVQATRVEGRILYCTCALSPLENDEVVRKMVAKRGTITRILEIPTEYGEKTEFGRHILPDTWEGMGPLYMALVEKTALP